MMSKKSPQLRFEGFTDDWEKRKLGEHTSLITKGTTPKDKSGNGTINFVKVENISNGVISSVSKISEDEHENYLKRSKLEDKDVLFSIAGTLGRTAVVDKSILPANTNQALAIIRGYDFDTYFLTTTLNGHVVAEFVRKNPTVGAQPNLSLEQVGKLIIGTPCKIEQNKIGTFFKQLDDFITLHQRKLDLLKEQKKGYLQNMFPKNGAKVPELRFAGFADDWEERKLIDIAGNISDGDWIEANHIFDTGDYRIVQTGNIGIGSFLDKLQNAKYFYQADFDELKANEIFPGDILISRLSDPAGRTSILPDLGVRAVTAVDVAIIRPNDNFHAEFLVAELNSSTILAKVDSLASGSTRKRISRKNLEGVQINLPTFEEQQKIGSFFKQLDDTIALHQRKFDLLKEQKKGFLQKMFV